MSDSKPLTARLKRRVATVKDVKIMPTKSKQIGNAYVTNCGKYPVYVRVTKNDRI